jgi:plastocyanin domain-containing protein
MEIIFEKILVVALGMMITLSLGAPLLMQSINFVAHSQGMLELEEFSVNMNNLVSMVDSNQVDSIQQQLTVPNSIFVKGVDKNLVIIYQQNDNINKTFSYSRFVKVSGFGSGSVYNIHVYRVGSDWIYVNFLLK